MSCSLGNLASKLVQPGINYLFLLVILGFYGSEYPGASILSSNHLATILVIC